MTDLRLLFSSNLYKSSTGYGVQAASLLPRLADMPEFGGRQNIAQHAWYGLQGATIELDGFRIYPAGLDPYGNDIIEAHTKHWRANLVITLIDAWVLKATAAKVAPALWCPYLPIDHDPVPACVLDALQGAHLPISYSQWGRDRMHDAGMPCAYIPMGVEPTIFRVATDADAVRDFKQSVAPGCNHLTVMVAANKGYPDRKAFQVQLRAWTKFAVDKPGARLYLHTESSPMNGGVDLLALARNLGIDDRLIFPDRYQYFTGFPTQFMAMLYNAADVLLGASMAEGFGIPLIEAQACGCPVITTDFSSMPELVRWGTAVKPLDLFWTPLDAWQAWPDMVGIWNALEELYSRWHMGGDAWPLDQRMRTQNAIHSEFGWDVIAANYWAPLMTRLAGEVG